MPFPYLLSSLHCDSVPLAALADQYGTPLYVYSATSIRENYRRLAAPFAPLVPSIKFALKANSNLAILRLLKEEGAGFDVVSGGEIYRALQAGADAASLSFAGVGKTDAELAYALNEGVGWFNVESADELAALERLAARDAANTTATVALRLNPNVAANTHRHIRTGASGDKFGLEADKVRTLLNRAGDFPHLHIRGLHFHIGSQIPDPADTVQAIEAALALLDSFPALDTLDIGGGFPVLYTSQDDYPPIEAFAAPIVSRLQSARPLYIHLEPGRYLVADAGCLVLTVQAVKQSGERRIVIVDGGMNVLLRPALYDARHLVLPVGNSQRQTSNLKSPLPPGSLAPLLTPGQAAPPQITDLAGPICESADFLARDVLLPADIQRGERIAVMNTGAYGMTMASNYNSQPLPAEVLVEGDTARLIRRRQTVEEMLLNEFAV